MNCSEFLDYRTTCPFCNNRLITKFRSNSGRTELLNYEENRLIANVKMDSLNVGGVSYLVGYSFGLKDNSFMVEISQDNNRSKYRDSVPLSLLRMYNEFTNNIVPFRMIQGCGYCARYMYSTLPIVLGSATYDLSLYIETFLLQHNKGLIKLVSTFDGNNSPSNSEISTYPYVNIWSHTYSEPEARTTYIPFVSNDETFERVHSLLAFL